MGFLNSEGLQYLVNKLSDSSNIKIAGNPNGTRVGAVVDKLVEKTDTITGAVDMEIENTAGSFRVGTGLGSTDVSATVEDGFSEIDVKGKTLQNLVNLDVSNNNFGTSGNGSGLSINRYKTGCEYKVVDETKTSHITVRFLQNKIVKPSTTYTLFFNVETNFPDTYKGITVCQISDSYFGNSNNRLAYSATFEYKNKRACISFTTLNSEVSLEHLGFGLPSIASHSLNPNDYFRIFDIMLLEGDHTNTPLSELPYVEGIQGVGNASKNLIDNKLLVIFNKDNYVCSSLNYSQEPTISIKPNTKYILSSNKMTSSQDRKGYLFSKGIKTREVYFEGSFTTSPVEDGISFYAKITDDSSATIENAKIQLEEGSVATSYEPYISGVKVDVKSCGKNLLYDTLDKIVNYVGTYNALGAYSVIDGRLYYIGMPSDHRNTKDSPMIRCKPNTTYTIWVENPCRIEAGNPSNMAKISDSNGLATKLTFTTEISQTLLSLKIWNFSYINTTEKYLIGNIQIEETLTQTPYQPYISDKSEIYLDEPLHKLPNGVYDEISGGKLIRRVGKVVFDGSEDWIRKESLDNNTTERYVLTRPSLFIPNSRGICSTIPYQKGGSSNDYTSIFIHPNTAEVQVKKHISDGRWRDITTFKKWLSENPTTVYYELAKPIITDLPQPVVRIFKDGHLSFDTTVSPGSTHKVLLNKSAQIEDSVREVQSLDARVDRLESFYDNMILETSHKLNLLDLDFDYIEESEEV